MGLFDFSTPPGPLRTTLRVLYLCLRSAAAERRSDEFDVTPKRCAVLLLLAVLLPLLAWWNALGLLLDELLFPAYRQQQIVAPIFIQGGARSGTTAMHRLLAQDPQLTAMSTWEMVLAPSITWRRLFAWLGRLDSLTLCGALSAVVAAFASRIAAATAVVHEVQVFGAEEDEWVMAHIGAAQLLAFFFPILDDFGPVVDFDAKLPAQTKRAILDYYVGCVRRHLYAHGGSRTYVAKNPTFNRRMRWLQSAFPDARFVVMTRAPAESVPSLVCYIGAVWNAFCSPRARCPLARPLTDLQPGDIAYPLDALRAWPEGQRAVVANAALRTDCIGAVAALYGKLGLVLSPEFAAKAKAAMEAAKGHKSAHRYSIEDTGMFADEFEAYFAESVERVARLEKGDWE